MELADVIAAVESKGDQYAQRFERIHLGASSPSLLSRIAQANNCSQPTADVYASMSHGLFQIMGFRLYGDGSRDARNLDYNGKLSAFLANAQLQREIFNRYVKRAEIDYSVSVLIQDAVRRAHFAEVYNGPANVAEYSSRILAVIYALNRAA